MNKLMGHGGKDNLQGGDGADTLTANEGSDVLLSGPGKDKINARDNDYDDINCGAGPDYGQVDAGTGDNTCGGTLNPG